MKDFIRQGLQAMILTSNYCKTLYNNWLNSDANISNIPEPLVFYSRVVFTLATLMGIGLQLNAL